MRTTLVVWLALLMLAGCNPIRSDQQENSLRKTLWAYEQTVRWGELYKVWGFQTESLQQEHPPPDNLANIRVTGYEQLEAPVELEEDVVRVVARIQYIRKDRQVLQEFIDRQLWRYDEERNGWKRSNPVPGF